MAILHSTFNFLCYVYSFSLWMGGGGRSPGRSRPGYIPLFSFPHFLFLFLISFFYSSPLLYACSRSKARRYQIGRWVEPRNALLRIYDLTVLLDISLNTLLGILGEIDSFLFLEKELIISILLCFSTYTRRYCFYNQKFSVGWQGGRSVGYFTVESNNSCSIPQSLVCVFQLKPSVELWLHRRMDVFFVI